MKLIPLHILAALTLAGNLAHADAPQYSVIDLGSLAGGTTNAFGISENGQVTGNSMVGGAMHAFLYSGGSMLDLGTLGNDATGYGVNNSGQVVGLSHPSLSPREDAFLYSGGSMQDLGSLDLAGTTIAYGINNAGQIAGTGTVAGFGGFEYSHAFIYSGGIMTDLTTLNGYYANSDAYAINQAGWVTGDSNTNHGSRDAFLYLGPGNMLDLGTLGGTYGTGYGINDAGQVTGSSTLAGDSLTHAFLYSGGSLLDLGTFGGTVSEGKDINNLGQIVGYSRTTNGEDHGFLYSGGTMYDLNNLVGNSYGTISYAYGINDSGEIVATAGNHALLLTPTPEPGGAVLLLVGAGLLAGRLRRTKPYTHGV